MRAPKTNRILILTHEFRPTRGGIATYVEATAQAAAMAGREVEVWAPGAAGQAGDAQLSYAVRRLPLRGNQNWPDRWRLRTALRASAIDWSQTTLYLPEPGPIRLWLYADLLRLPSPARLVLTFHGSELLYLRAWPHRHHRLVDLCRRADRIGVVSQFVRSLLEEIVPEAGGKIVIAPGAPSPALAALAAVREPEIALSATRPESRPVRLVSVARVHPRKGLMLAVEAIGRLPPELKARVRYDIVGPVRKPAFARCLTLRARELGIILHFHGTLPAQQIAEVFCQTDLLLFPSRELPKSVEGLGLAILEAGLFGVPTLATRTGGTREAIADRHTGLLVPSEDPVALGEALETLLQDSGLRRELGKNAADWVPQQFSWRRNAHALFG